MRIKAGFSVAAKALQFLSVPGYNAIVGIIRQQFNDFLCSACFCLSSVCPIWFSRLPMLVTKAMKR
jgi:hypothetical protein